MTACVWILSLFITSVYSQTNRNNGGPASKSYKSDKNWMDDSDSWGWDDSSDGGRGPNTINRGWDSDSWESNGDSSERGFPGRPKVAGNRISTGSDSQWDSDSWENDESSDNRLRGNGKKTKDGNGGNFDSSDGWRNDESSERTLRTNSQKRTLRTNSQKRTKQNGRDTDSSYESWYSDSDSDDFGVPKRGSKRPILKFMKSKNIFGGSSDASYDSWERDFDSGDRGLKTSKSKSKPQLSNYEASSDWYSDESDNWYDSDRNGRNRGNGGGGKNGLKQNRDSDSSDWFSDESDIRGGRGSKRGNGKGNTISNRDSDNWSSDSNDLWDSDSYERMRPAKGLKRGSRDSDDDSDESIKQNNRLIKRLRLTGQKSRRLRLTGQSSSEDNTRLPAGVSFLGNES